MNSYKQTNNSARSTLFAILFHFDQVFTILEILVSEKAKILSFEIRRILKRSVFSAVTRDWTLGRNGTVYSYYLTSFCLWSSGEILLVSEYYKYIVPNLNQYRFAMVHEWLAFLCKHLRPPEAPTYVCPATPREFGLKSAIIWGWNPLFWTGMSCVMCVTPLKRDVTKKFAPCWCRAVCRSQYMMENIVIYIHELTKCIRG
jgi:hypothetical protein